MPECKIVKEDVQPDDIKKSDLTTDCHFVFREDGQVDVARGNLVGIFDNYHDRGIKLRQIMVSGGTLNPKLNDPKI